MEQEHRMLINNNLSYLMDVTNDLKSIVDLLLEKDIINKWMKDYILVRKMFLNNFYISFLINAYLIVVI